MIKKKLIIIIAVLFTGVILFTIYHFCYLRKAVIYDLKKIEFQGISNEQVSEIEIFGTTPLNKRILIKSNNPLKKNQITGCYQFIELIIPDTLLPKITSIQIILKKQLYTLNTYELKS
ncbi:MAG: hypothetical protein PHI15_10390 [Methanomicrobium sp.]|nr:hypothetical protein [Methanomicrobium sp.]